MDRGALERSLSYVDSWLGWRMARVDVPGCAVAVSLAGEVLLSAGYGSADLASGRPMRGDDVFRIASHSKTFTATAVMQLVEAGRLRLDDPVAAHLGWLGGHRDERWRQVTLRQLLCHGAGMVRDGLDSDFWQLRRPFPDGGQLRAEVLEAPLVTAPNVALKYSNFGYGLLGAVVEAASGLAYAAYVDAHITGPLGLAATAAEPSGELAGRVVTGYGRRRPDGTRPVLPPVSTGALGAATGFAGTAPELCRYLSAHIPGNGLLLGDASKREMQRVHWHALRSPAGVDEDYGLGLVLEAVGERRTAGHSGGWPGHITRSLVDPADGIAVSVLTNCIDGPASEVARGILSTIDAFQASGAPARRDHPEVDPARFEGRFVGLWSAHDVVVAGGEVLVGRPDTWAPLVDPDRLEVVDAETCLIADTKSFGSAGEPVAFHFTDDAPGPASQAPTVETVTWAGATYWPEERWPEAERELLDGTHPHAPPDSHAPSDSRAPDSRAPDSRAPEPGAPDPGAPDP